MGDHQGQKVSIKVATGCVGKALHLRGCRHAHHDVMVFIADMDWIDQRFISRW